MNRRSRNSVKSAGGVPILSGRRLAAAKKGKNPMAASFGH